MEVNTAHLFTLAPGNQLSNVGYVLFSQYDDEQLSQVRRTQPFSHRKAKRIVIQ